MFRRFYFYLKQHAKAKQLRVSGNFSVRKNAIFHSRCIATPVNTSLNSHGRVKVKNICKTFRNVALAAKVAPTSGYYVFQVRCTKLVLGYYCKSKRSPVALVACSVTYASEDFALFR